MQNMLTLEPDLYISLEAIHNKLYNNTELQVKIKLLKFKLKLKCWVLFKNLMDKLLVAL